MLPPPVPIVVPSIVSQGMSLVAVHSALLVIVTGFVSPAAAKSSIAGKSVSIAASVVAGIAVA